MTAPDAADAPRAGDAGGTARAGGATGRADGAGALRVSINGAPQSLPPGSTVESLLRRLGLCGRPCAVEVNRAIVPRSRHAEHVLGDGDRVEIVSFVGGG